MVKGAKAPSSAITTGKTSAATKGGKSRPQDEKTIDETVSHTMFNSI